MKKHTVLIVDDDNMTRQTLSLALEDDYNTHTATNGLSALELLGEQEVEVVLSDLDMPGLNGIELLERINDMDNPVPVIVITGQGTIETAVEAMKLGACDYVSKPINLDRLALLIEKTLETKRLKEENKRLKRQILEHGPELNLIGQSQALRKCEELALQVAATKATVLIEGESGTGKELITNIIHYNSPVAHGPFIKINCSAFSEGVLESELFGHEKGAFTGAVAAKKGRFELADAGTLFLDEIGETPLSIQVKLLRFLQEQTFERVGGTKTIKVDVRIISATNKNLDQLVKEGTFREDLFYLDRKLAANIIPPYLPFIKRQALAAISKQYDSLETARVEISRELQNWYRKNYPELIQDNPTLFEEAVQGALQAYEENVFPKMHVTWGTYRNNLGHENDSGCFRCHGALQETRTGRIISSDCNLCHAILEEGEEHSEITEQIKGVIKQKGEGNGNKKQQ
ncbi:MAG: response regulator [Desulfobulbaceae bacterium]|nr:response regulator [Desulfobulbaceae bacterium]